MNNSNFRKRRPYGHEEAHAVPLAHDPSFSTITSPVQSFSPSELNILEQAAAILHCPLPLLLSCDSRSSHLPPPLYDSPLSQDISAKRPRLNTDFTTMPSQEKPSPLDQGNFGHHGASIGGFIGLDPSRLDPSRLTQYFTGFNMCSPCVTCEPQGYAGIPATSSYDYASSRPYLDARPGPLPIASTLSENQPRTYAAHDGPIAHQIFSGYPVMQPERPTAIQPITSPDEMVYPGPGPIGNYAEQPEVQYSSPDSSSSNMTIVKSHQTASPDQSVERTRRYTTNKTSVDLTDEGTRPSKQAPDLDVVQPNQRPPPARRGPFKSQDARERTAETRRIGSCIRCRMQRIRCETNPDDVRGCCMTCERVSNVKIWRLPCLRYKITEVKLFKKPGQVPGYEWTQRWQKGVTDDISTWDPTDMEIKKIRLTEGYIERTIDLRVRKFIPQDGDSTHRSWVVNGHKRSVKIPNYAIVNLEEAKSTYCSYISQNITEFCKSALSGKDRLISSTYTFAMRLVRDTRVDEKEKDMLKKALELWMAIRMTTKSTVIVGEETLGMKPDIMDETSPLQGKIPLPPVMGAQIELVLIHQIQSSLRRDILESLQSMTQANKQQTWFTTYLITFILLHNVALLCDHDAGYAKKHGMKTRFARISNVREYQEGANILLAYFHYCNKGIYPFSEECKDQDLKNLAGLDELRMKFIKYTRTMIAQYRPQWDKMRQKNEYENDFYYISQLYEENWMPLEVI
ncbi:hypothetical protein GGR57DRAFT_209438 [Xylariaceae sp. FL1272]|nr:hypothetical protein GGR57DRAFT_209438 [Xylariaceae sp. FL1272]